MLTLCRARQLGSNGDAWKWTRLHRLHLFNQQGNNLYCQLQLRKRLPRWANWFPVWIKFVHIDLLSLSLSLSRLLTLSLSLSIVTLLAVLQVKKRRFEAQKLGILQKDEKLPDDDYQRILKPAAKCHCQECSVRVLFETNYRLGALCRQEAEAWWQGSSDSAS